MIDAMIAADSFSAGFRRSQRRREHNDRVRSREFRHNSGMVPWIAPAPRAKQNKVLLSQLVNLCGVQLSDFSKIDPGFVKKLESTGSNQSIAPVSSVRDENNSLPRAL